MRHVLIGHSTRYSAAELPPNIDAFWHYENFPILVLCRREIEKRKREKSERRKNQV
jgi:hypothetical protein